MVGEGCGSDRWRAEPESSDPQTVVAMRCFIVKQRSQLEKTISGYGFAESGWRLGINGSRVETMRLDNIIVVMANRGLLLMHVVVEASAGAADGCVATVESRG
ncbi:hypothetical protein B296_00005355 [Ensete ventricosum]|uniref:Uncharacterized protein n=1 Tax=Ensete ventricosum TaxID=4639 RepID=A0A427B468_ENSVE|nr:hypothetical protein B296_00005355 [Ensete ventricosum]